MKAQYAIVRTYWRDNRDPFPGRLTETRTERIKEEPVTMLSFSQSLAAPETLAERCCLRKLTQLALENHKERQILYGDRYEDLVDRAQEGGYQ